MIIGLSWNRITAFVSIATSIKMSVIWKDHYNLKLPARDMRIGSGSYITHSPPVKWLNCFACEEALILLGAQPKFFMFAKWMDALRSETLMKNGGDVDEKSSSTWRNFSFHHDGSCVAIGFGFGGHDYCCVGYPCSSAVKLELQVLSENVVPKAANSPRLE